MIRMTPTGFLVVLAASANLHAQVNIYPAVRADIGNTGPAVEPAIVASTLAPGELLVGWIDWRTGKNQIGYAISVDAGNTFTDGVLTVPSELGPTLLTQNSADPMVACDPLTGDLWIGGFSTTQTQDPNGLFIARKALGVSSLGTSIMIEGPNTGANPKTDKPLMAAGPNPFNPAEAYLYATWNRSGAAPPPFYNAFHKVTPRRVRVPDTGAPGSFGPAWIGDPASFVSQSNDPFHGAGSLGPFPVVIPATSPQNRGRLVVVWRTKLWRAVLSDDAGQTWTPSTSPYYHSVLPSAEDAGEDDIPGPFKFSGVPSVSVDRNTGSVYAVVAARREPGSKNVDLWVHRSLDQGATWPANQVFHLTDADLGTVAQSYYPDQFMPSIVIDDFGAVNLLWYDTRQDGGVLKDDHPSALLDAYYARIVNLGGPSQTIEVHRLTSQTFTTAITNPNHPYGSNGVANNPQFVGDYQWIAASGCQVYPCYMSAHTGERHVYVHRINICPTDTDDSGLIAASDAVLFIQLFPVGDPRADINRDQVVNAADAVEFQARFAAGGP